MPRRQANGTCSFDKWEPGLGLAAAHFNTGTLALLQKALLPPPPPPQGTMPMWLSKISLVVSTVTLREITELPQEDKDVQFFAGGPAGVDGAHNCATCQRGFGITPTCPTLTNSAWRASSFFRADLGDSGKTSLKERLLSMF